jgi:hypothetical protein
VSNSGNDANKVKLVCKEGCAWNKLSFHCVVGCDQDVNYYGMMTSPQNEDGQLAAFVVNIHRAEDQVLLSCDTGCAWKTLSFRQPPKGQSQTVDAYGMTSIQD